MKTQALWTCVLLLVLSSPLQAEPPNSKQERRGPDQQPSFNEDEKAILGALRQRQNVDLPEITLLDFADYFRSLQIPTRISIKALEESGIGLDTTITCHARQKRLLDVLDSSLEDKDLSWTIHNGFLLITSEEHAAELLLTRIYDVRNIVEPGPSSDFDSLIDMIQSTIQPDSWADAGGPASIEPYSTPRMRVLAVSQTFRAHLKIQEFLEELGRIGGLEPLPDRPGTSDPKPKGSLRKTSKVSR